MPVESEISQPTSNETYESVQMYRFISVKFLRARRLRRTALVAGRPEPASGLRPFG